MTRRAPCCAGRPPQIFPNQLQSMVINMKNAIVLIPLIFTCACTVGPNYHRPNIDLPSTYRGAPPQEATQPQQTVRSSVSSSEQSFGDQKWFEVFQDPQLQNLVRTALTQNYDVRIAATRILEAQAQLGITRADQLPTINGGAASVNSRFARQKLGASLPAFETDTHAVGAGIMWELDFWGKYRRATEAARANLLATEWAHRAVTNTLVSEVAAAYFQLRAYDLQLEISQETLDSRQSSLRLTETLERGGATNLLDVRQAQQLVDVAAESIPDFQRHIQQQENLHQHASGKQSGADRTWNDVN